MGTPLTRNAAIDTAAVKDRRSLRFENPDQMLMEVRRIAEAERRGRLRRTGNWTPGQIFGHLAAFIDYAYDGYPDKPPLWIKLLLRPMRRRFLSGRLPSGARIPGAKEGTWATDPLGLEDGLARLERAWQRLRAKAPEAPNPVFGPLGHEQWIQLHLRHAELHLGFLHPEDVDGGCASSPGGRDD